MTLQEDLELAWNNHKDKDKPKNNRWTLKNGKPCRQKPLSKDALTKSPEEISERQPWVVKRRGESKNIVLIDDICGEVMNAWNEAKSTKSSSVFVNGFYGKFAGTRREDVEFIVQFIINYEQTSQVGESADYMEIDRHSQGETITSRVAKEVYNSDLFQTLVSIETLENVVDLEDVSQVQELWLSSTTHVPCLIPSKDLWSPRRPTLSEIWTAVSLEVSRQGKQKRKDCQLDILRDGERMDGDPETLLRAAHTSLLQTQTGPIDDQSLYVIFNIWAKNMPYTLRIPEFITNPMRVTSGPETCYFATPAGAHTKLHHDLTQGVISDIWGEKFWLCYPPTTPNLEEYNATSGFENRLAKCGPRMKAGCIIKQCTGKSLYLPPGTLHEVLTNKGGFVANSTFSLVEGLGAMARVIAHTLSSFQPNQSMLKGDIKAYTVCVLQTMEIGNGDCTDRAISSWLDMVEYVRSVARTHAPQVEKELAEWFKQLNERLRRWARNYSLPGDCKCGQSVDNVGSHFLNDHIIKW